MSSKITERMKDAIENELIHQVARLDEVRTRKFHAMLTYHMGWSGEGAGPQAAGKRIRPLITLLAMAAVSNRESDIDWLRAVPAATAIELVHNFSLVHDDIQDNSALRRGRRTVWAVWGEPMAINAGDALFVLANQSILDLRLEYPAEMVIQAAKIFSNSCLDLTKGQYLDMSYEERDDLTLEDYWPMVGGKTSSLLSACTHLGALLGYAKDEKQESYRLFGYHLGLAFQVQDDILGIWGEEALTGKSSASDLVEGKNSLPILFALEKNSQFAVRWRQGPITSEEVATVAKLLEDEGAKTYAQQVAEAEMTRALEYLHQADPQGEAGQALLGLAKLLLERKQ